MINEVRPRNWVQRSFRPPASNLGQRVVNGAAFTFVGIAFRTGITIGSMAILARLLTPADFGHLAMATVITELAAVFSNFGFGSILIQRPRVSRIQIDTMHWCAIGLGLLLTLTVFGLSFFAKYLFQDTMVGSLLRVLCLIFIFEELNMVPRSLMSRRMQFKQDFYVQSAMLLVRASVAITMALNGFGVWSLVWSALAGVATQTMAYGVLTGYWPRLKFSVAFLKSTRRINSSYFGNGVLFYLNANVDFLLVGRALGASMLGQYQNARSLTDEVHVRMVQPLQRVLFPAFSAIQNDTDRFRAGILRSGRLLALTFTPIGFGIAAVAPELVKVLYGEQWLPMIPILQIIAIATGLGATATIGSPIFNATNRTGLLFKLYFVQTILNISFMLFGSLWGLMGIAWSRLALVIVTLVFFRIAIGLVKMRTQQIWQIMGAPLIAASLMWWLIDLARNKLNSVLVTEVAQLMAMVGIGVVFYAVCSLLIAPQHVRDVKEVISKLNPKATHK